MNEHRNSNLPTETTVSTTSVDTDLPTDSRQTNEVSTTDETNTTTDACLSALRTAARQLGHSPSKADYEALGLTPASATIIRTLGGWNAAKEEAGLKTHSSTGSRVTPPPDDIDIDDSIRAEWATLSVDQRWHYRNREQNATRTLRRRDYIRAWVFEYKAASDGCSNCSEHHPACLDFHHLNPETKEKSISKMITYGYGKARLREEIEKCELLCANCHRKLHHRNRTGSWKRGRNENELTGDYENESLDKCEPENTTGYVSQPRTRSLTPTHAPADDD
ncbi:homing endonuclease associated repeat-containing protein [Haloprofundus halophilus]|uniref:homing endonuclease associated repeat-containing protein n=1 Tax=Haloprofundus halophilus TaxID=2283527 RepID=UPI0018E51F78|nr:hypothetical protein [Haloprofundus halophilus]